MGVGPNHLPTGVPCPTPAAAMRWMEKGAEGTSAKRLTTASSSRSPSAKTLAAPPSPSPSPSVPVLPTAGCEWSPSAATVWVAPPVATVRQPRPARSTMSACASIIWPVRSMQPQPASLVREEPSIGAKPCRYVSQMRERRSQISCASASASASSPLPR